MPRGLKYNRRVRCLANKASGLKFLLGHMKSLTYKVSGLKFVIGNKIQ